MGYTEDIILIQRGRRENMSDKPRRWKAVGVLDIGSNYVRMGIYQAGKGGAQRLELLEHPLRIGHEVFTSGRISVETVRRLSEILRGYSQVMKEYGVTEYRAIATTALREARNRAYVVDQLKTQNNLVVEVLQNGEESALVYAALLGLPGVQAESMLAYIGTGSVGVAAWDGRTIQQTCNITIGFQKLGETLRSLEEQTAGFYKALEEYVETYFRRLTLRLGERRFGSLTLTGRNLEVIAPPVRGHAAGRDLPHREKAVGEAVRAHQGDARGGGRPVSVPVGGGRGAASAHAGAVSAYAGFHPGLLHDRPAGGHHGRGGRPDAV